MNHYEQQVLDTLVEFGGDWKTPGALLSAGLDQRMSRARMYRAVTALTERGLAQRQTSETSGRVLYRATREALAAAGETAAARTAPPARSGGSPPPLTAGGSDMRRTVVPELDQTYRADLLPAGSVGTVGTAEYVISRNGLCMKWEQPIPGSGHWLVTYAGRLADGVWMTHREWAEVDACRAKRSPTDPAGEAGKIAALIAAGDDGKF